MAGNQASVRELLGMETQKPRRGNWVQNLRLLSELSLYNCCSPKGSHLQLKISSKIGLIFV